MLRKLFIVGLLIGAACNVKAHTLAIVKDINDINYVSLTKIAKYNLRPDEYGTVVVNSFGRPGDPEVALTGHLTDANAPDLPPAINKVIFMGHGGPGHLEGIGAPALAAEITRLMGVLNGADKLAVDNLRILSCGSATRPVGEDTRSATDAIIDGLAAANILGLVVTVQGNAGTSITNVFTEGIDDIIRIVKEDRAGEVEEIQQTLEDETACTLLVEDCPGGIRDIFGTIHAERKATFARYVHYLQNEPDLTPIQRAYLAYYNQGVRTFYHELIGQSDIAEHLFPLSDGLFNTRFNSTHYLDLTPADRVEYLTLVKNGNPPAIGVVPPPPAVDAPPDEAPLVDEASLVVDAVPPDTTAATRKPKRKRKEKATTRLQRRRTEEEEPRRRGGAL